MISDVPKDNFGTFFFALKRRPLGKTAGMYFNMIWFLAQQSRKDKFLENQFLYTFAFRNVSKRITTNQQQQ